MTKTHYIPCNDVCEVCGAPSVGVAASSLGAFSSAYCHDCLVCGAEPWDMLAVSLSCCGPDGHAAWVDNVIAATIKRTGRTREELDEEVRKA